MISRPPSFEKLLQLLRSLPSVGPKMSERMAFHLLKMPPPDLEDFLRSVRQAYDDMRPCPVCGHWDDSSPCRICQDSARDRTVLCVVENSQDVAAVSRVKNFRGVYHVLGGTLSPLEGVGPGDLHIQTLLARLKKEPVVEVILALNPDIEGETTAQYLSKQIQALFPYRNGNGENGIQKSVKVTRLAQGLPAGGELEYMDEITLGHAFEGRKTADWD